MKKTRLISLFLAAAMATSALPMAVSAAGTDDVTTPVGVNLLEGGAFGNSVAPVNVAENKFFRMNNVPANGWGGNIKLKLNNELAANTEYCVVMDMRAQVDTIGRGVRFKVTTASKTDTTALAVSKSWGSSGVCNFTTKATATNEININVWGRWSFQDVAPLEIDNIYIYPKNGSVNNAVAYFGFTENDTASLMSWEREYGVETAYARADGTQDAVYTLADNGVKLVPGVYKLSGEARMAYFFANPDHNKALYGANEKGIVHDKDCAICAAYNYDTSRTYHSLGSEATATNNTSLQGTDTAYYNIYYKYTYDHVKKAGSAAVVEHSNYRTLKATLVGDGTSLPIRFNSNQQIYATSSDTTLSPMFTALSADGITIGLTDDWSKFESTFEITADMCGENGYVEYDALTFAGNGKAYDNDAYDLRKLSLVCLDTYDEEETTSTTISGLGFSGSSTGISVSTGARDGNKYLAIYNRANNWDGLRIHFDSVKGAKYTVSFNVRSAVDVNARVSDRFGGIYYNLTNEWQTIENVYTGTANSTELVLAGGTAGIYSYPIDIDNIEVRDAQGQIVYSEYFGSYDVGVLDGGFVLESEGGYVNRRLQYGAEYAIAVDQNYFSANIPDGDSFYYDDGTTVLEPGTYFLKGTFRNGEYKNGASDAIGDDRDTDTTIVRNDDSYYLVLVPDRDEFNADGKGKILDNNNGFNMYANVYTADGVIDGSGKAVEVTTGWTDFSLAFRIEEATTLNKIEFVFDHLCSVETVVDVDYKNIALEYKDTRETVSGINPGILLVLLLKKQAAQGDAALSSIKINNGYEGARKAVETVTENPGNKYVTVYNRLNNSDGIQLVFPTTVGEKYTITYSQRNAIEVNGLIQSRARVYEADSNGKPNTSKMIGELLTVPGTEWSEASVTVTANTAMTVAQIYGYIRSYYSYPLDFDNIKVVDSKGNVVLEQNFEAAQVGVLENTFKFGTDSAKVAANVTYGGEYAILAEDNYSSVVVDDLGGMTVESKVELQPGEYTLSADMRIGVYYNSTNVTAEPDDLKADETKYLTLVPDKSGFSQRSKVIDNNNGFVLTVKVQGAEATADVTAGWSTVTVSFTLTEAAALGNIDFIVEHMLDGTAVDFDFRNVTVTAADGTVTEIVA